MPSRKHRWQPSPARDQREITEKLLARGAAIEEINAVRRRISAVKGGKFAARCYPAKVITFALSDVLSNDRSVIASGITVPDETPDAFVKAAADRYLYDIDGALPDALSHREDCRINDGGYHFVGDINRLDILFYRQSCSAMCRTLVALISS